MKEFSWITDRYEITEYYTKNGVPSQHTITVHGPETSLSDERDLRRRYDENGKLLEIEVTEYFSVTVTGIHKWSDKSSMTLEETKAKYGANPFLHKCVQRDGKHLCIDLAGIEIDEEELDTITCKNCLKALAKSLLRKRKESKIMSKFSIIPDLIVE